MLLTCGAKKTIFRERLQISEGKISDASEMILEYL